MNEQKTKLSLEALELRIGITVTLCLLVCYAASFLNLQLQALAACTGAVMCVQEGGKASWKAGVNRLLGVVCGGVVGVLVVLLDNVIQIPVVFYVLTGLAIMANFVLCKLVKLPAIQGRVSCMTVLLVVLVLGGPARINYAIGRFIGTLVGAAVALLVSLVCEKLGKKAAK